MDVEILDGGVYTGVPNLAMIFGQVLDPDHNSFWTNPAYRLDFHPNPESRLDVLDFHTNPESLLDVLGFQQNPKSRLDILVIH